MTTARRRGRPFAEDPASITTDALLDVALDAFAEEGFGATSVRHLARTLGVSHNLIPQRIGTKEELWYAAVDRGFGQLALALAEAIQELGTEDDIARLRALVVRFIEVNARRPALLRIIRQEASSPGPRLDYLFERYIEPVRELGAGLLAGLRRNGEVRTDSVPLIYFLMTHGAGGPLALPALAERFGSTIDPDDEEAVRRHAEDATAILFDGLIVR